MRKITFSADEHLIEQVRQVAKDRGTSLEQLFRDWLADLVARQSSSRECEALMRDLRESGVTVGRSFSRADINER